MNTFGIVEDPPIYQNLVKEFGDVLAASREAAEQTQLRARQALDFTGGGSPQLESWERRTFSAFGERPGTGSES
ncbi:hypothetical protein [Streptomyces enissocaesilis]|uniref:Uncharacterized protein n=1 Tax=Streptomyces enissocaesilis TaxID=332589 RepID=A0ABN3XG48_9ACTN